ncbi:hypothetical protein M413DRAFT_70611 [Hebeloma cylindrosporum]|uniref:protein-histidine N-methyltransferase n=1 Tax=Hebeloma cylindrosporum TaxID=76867 RepID=A0A0C2YML8_HEBCY|nr:hypothetical protein M413DRAFT_70611 [Hebeloma cylindrosporum h7]
MFKFEFDIDDAENIDGLEHFASPKCKNTTSDPSPEVLEPFSEISLTQLLDALPRLISYSPLHIPLSSLRKGITLSRRDLFDARFQLISEGAGEEVDPIHSEESVNGPTSSIIDRKALEFLDAPSDLVPGVYEGGLKAWECSLDLVDYLEGLKDSSSFKGFSGCNILELGCGTAVPSIYLLHEIFSSINGRTGEPHTGTILHLQDYNASVLQLVTLPNVLLAWYTSTHVHKYRNDISDYETAPLINPSKPGELPITPELKTAFLSSLRELNITVRFFSGSWNTFNSLETIGRNGYDIFLTSESIYRNESLRPLITLMQAACTRSLETAIENLEDSSDAKTVEGDDRDRLCLVAAKILYFGVGGGVSDLLSAVEATKARVETVLERKEGVGRRVMRVWWM